MVTSLLQKLQDAPPSSGPQFCFCPFFGSMPKFQSTMCCCVCTQGWWVTGRRYFSSPHTWEHDVPWWRTHVLLYLIKQTCMVPSVFLPMVFFSWILILPSLRASFEAGWLAQGMLREYKEHRMDLTPLWDGVTHGKRSIHT